LGLVVEAMTYGAVDAKVAAVVAFVVAQVFVVVSGLRGSAWVAAIKDVLVVAVVAFLIVYLPLHYVGGIGPLLDRAVADHAEWLTFPGPAGPAFGPTWFISTVLLNAVTIVVYPNNVAAYLAASGPNVLRRNSFLLPWYQLLLFVPMAVGLTALVAIPTLADPDMALLRLVTDSLPAPAVGLVGVAAALSALVPTSVFMLAIGTLWGRTVLGGGLRAARSGDPLADGRQLRRAQWVCVASGAVALGGALFAPALLVRLSLLSYEGFAQLVPVVILGLLWRGMSRQGAWAGLASGVAVVVVLNTTGHDPVFGVNGGLLGLAVNLIVVVTMSRFAPRRIQAVDSSV
jgi:SSS family solute:Na+ symporter